MLLPNRITTEFLQYTEWLENKNLELTWSVLIVDPFLIPNSFSVPEEIWNKREKKSCITLLCRYRCSSLLRSAQRNYSVCRPDILHQKQGVIKAMCKISLHSTPLPREREGEAPKRKYTPSGSAQKMRHFHHFLASFYPLQKTSLLFFCWYYSTVYQVGKSCFFLSLI